MAVRPLKLGVEGIYILKTYILIIGESLEKDNTMEQYERKYVKVNVRFDLDGRMMPTSIFWDNDVQYSIDRVLDIRPAAAHRAGGQGDRYTIRVCGHETYLFFEHSPQQATSDRPGRWFVEAKQY